MELSKSERSDNLNNRSSTVARLEPVLPETASVIDGQLAIGGRTITSLVEEFGTPLHIYDEAGLRAQMRRLVNGMKARWPRSEVLFASKAAPFVAMYAIAAEEGMAIDVAGQGEIELALAAGVDPARIYFHGNAKTDAEIARAIELGVGTIIIDSEDEIERLDRLVPAGYNQRCLIRVNPGVDAQTHESMNTGGSKSKFGLPLSRVVELIAQLQDHGRIQIIGVHVHIGSQILNVDQFAQAVDALSGVKGLDTYDLGGGLGVAYVDSEIAPSVDDYLDTLIDAATRSLPAQARLLIEPGRASVARAGVTAYQTVVVKAAGQNFVAVDGGMADQLEIALTGQPFSAVIANKIDQAPTEIFQIVGRQCESGDLLVANAPLPTPQVGDIVVVPATGAYSYTMSNNYNGALRPPIILVADGQARLVARRETYDDLLRLHEPAIRPAN